MADGLFGHYELRGRLGRGGMGEVHRAFDTRKHREVALKLLRDDLGPPEQFRERFRREALLAAKLQDPHVVPIHDFGEIDGKLYIDMRLVQGTNAADLLDAEGPMPAARATAIVSQVAEALDAAHTAGVIHRDVKPSNILITPSDFVYLVDFGIARAAMEATSAGLTATGTAVGTMQYMAPEQFDGTPVDGRVDVYALACVFHELLTGRAPFQGGTLPAIMQAHLHTPPPRPGTTQPGIPTALDDVIVHGMAKRPEDRYSSTGQLATAARAALRPGADPKARTQSVVPPTPPPASGGPYPGAASGGPYPGPVPGAHPTHMSMPLAYQQPVPGATPIGAPFPAPQGLHGPYSGRPYPQPPQPRRGSGRRVLLVAGAIVAAVGLAVGSAFVASAVLAGNGTPTTTTPLAVEQTTTPPPSTSDSPQSTHTSSDLPGNAYGLPGAQGELATLVDPAIAGSCREVNADPDAVGVLAQIECISIEAQPTSTIVLLSFTDLDALNTQINRESRVASTGAGDYDQNCRAGQLVDTWDAQLDGQPVGGRIVCRTSDNPAAPLRIAWTFRDQLVTAYAEGTSPQFYAWWQRNAAALLR